MLIIEVSDNAQLDDFVGLPSGSELGNFGSGQGNSNPGIPNNIYGIKFDLGSELAYDIEFQSTRSPVWGDFYAKDGGPYAYNLGFADTDPSDSPSNGSLSYHILRPDTQTTPVPEPATLLLMGMALVVLTGIRRAMR